MKTQNVTQQAMPLYNSEYRLFDGEEFVTFNFLDMNADKNTVTVAVTRQGRISVMDLNLMTDEKDDLYFEFGTECQKVDLDYFTI